MNKRNARTVAVNADLSLSEAAEYMASEGVSSVLVFDSQGARGVLTERGIVKAVAAGVNPTDVNVAAVMVDLSTSADLFFIRSDASQGPLS